MTTHQLTILSTYAALLPIIVGIIVFKKAGNPYRLLLFLLLYGFVTDFFVGKLYSSGEEYISRFLFNVYAPVEAVLFSYFIYKTGYSKIIRQIALYSIIIWILTWIVLNIDFKILQWVDTTYNGTFVSAYEMVIASLAAASILYLSTTDETLYKFPLFWSLTGIFIYCFCTFFVNALVQTKVMNEIWFMHNIINIITYLIFTKAFLCIRSNVKL